MELKAADFREKVLASDKPVVVDVWASWCPNCKVLEPVFREVAEENKGAADFFMLKAEDNRALVKSLKVMGVPTLLFFRHGILVAKKPGVRSKKAIEQQLAPLYDYDQEQALANQYKGFLQRILGQ